MAQDNTVTLTGNVTRDVEVNFTNSGTAVASFGLAVNRRWMNKQTNEFEEKVSFFDIKAWQDLGENAAASINKGDRVTVTGRLEQDTWEDKETGKNRSKVEVIADDVAISLRWGKVLDFRKTEKSGGGGRPTGRGQASAPSTGRGAPAQAQADYGEEPF